MKDKDKDHLAELDAVKERSESEERDPKELFQQVSHIAITMSYDLIDKLRFYEKETLKLSDEEIGQRIPHMVESLTILKNAYVKFAEVDF